MGAVLCKNAIMPLSGERGRSNLLHLTSTTILIMLLSIRKVDAFVSLGKVCIYRDVRIGLEFRYQPQQLYSVLESSISSPSRGEGRQ